MGLNSKQDRDTVLQDSIRSSRTAWTREIHRGRGVEQTGLRCLLKAQRQSDERW